eukprot:scaffold20100_cov142-Skeletonema_marinoi.AAC.1
MTRGTTSSYVRPAVGRYIQPTGGGNSVLLRLKGQDAGCGGPSSFKINDAATSWTQHVSSHRLRATDHERRQSEYISIVVPTWLRRSGHEGAAVSSEAGYGRVDPQPSK